VTADATFVFLSAAWIAAVRAIHDEYAAHAPAPTVTLRANLVVVDAPFADPVVQGYVDTTAGLSIEPGLLDAADFTATVDYATARTLFLGEDIQAVLSAVMGGKIRLTGDASKLLTIAVPPPGTDPAAEAMLAEAMARIRALTA
jgi:hypothetical protein